MWFRRRWGRDWTGLWYTIAEEDRGVRTLFTTLKIDVEKNEIAESFDVPHAARDGLGGMMDLLRREGYAVGKPPASRSERPSLAEGVRALWRFLRTPKSRHTYWKRGLNPRARAESPATVHWISFTRAESERLEAMARDKKVSFSALTLAALNRVLAADLTAGELPSYWVFPVNMRGPVWLDDPLANHTSMLALPLTHVTTATEIHAEVRRQFSEHVHWAYWWVLNLGRFIGKAGMRLMAKFTMRENYWMGSFSNVGVWPEGDAGAEDPRFVWAMASPYSPNFPIVAACLKWKGRWTFTMKLHPSLGLPREKGDEYFAQFREALLGPKVAELPVPTSETVLPAAVTTQVSA